MVCVCVCVPLQFGVVDSVVRTTRASTHTHTHTASSTDSDTLPFYRIAEGKQSSVCVCVCHHCQTRIPSTTCFEVLAQSILAFAFSLSLSRLGFPESLTCKTHQTNPLNVELFSINRDSFEQQLLWAITPHVSSRASPPK